MKKESKYMISAASLFAFLLSTGGRMKKESRMRMFYDIDTQHDFMDKGGALYVPDAELIKPNLERLNLFARVTAYTGNACLAGSVDLHFGTEEYKAREGELQRWGGPFPDHCMAKTKGQRKIAETWFPLVDQRLNMIVNDFFYSNSGAKIDEAYLKRLIGNYRHTPFGIFFEKQSYDVFSNPSFEVFLDIAEVKQAIVYGVATDYCVKAAVLGMQERGIQCFVVEDAIKGVAQETTKAAIDYMKRSGAKFITTKDILEERIKWAT